MGKKLRTLASKSAREESNRANTLSELSEDCLGEIAGAGCVMIVPPWRPAHHMSYFPEH